MRRWWQRRSLRLRLTVWYAVTSTVILVVLGGTVFFVISGRLVGQLDRQLRGDFEILESQVTRDSSGRLHWQGYGREEAETGGEIDPWFEILSSTGTVLLHQGPSSNWEILSSVARLGAGFKAFSAETERHLH